MLHFQNKTPKPAPTLEVEPTEPEIDAPQMQDRADQRMTTIIGALFSVSSFTCQIAIALLGLFFITIIAEGREVGMLAIFCALGFSLILGMLVLDFTHARALAGYRAAREKNAKRSKAWASGIFMLLLGMVHPLMALAIPFSASIGALGHLLLNRLSLNEPLWDFLPKEAISVLAGRDSIGRELCTTRPRTHVMASAVTKAGTALCVMTALATGSYLVAEDIMAMAAVVPLTFGSLWASEAIIEYAENHLSKRDTSLVSAQRVTRLDTELDGDSDPLGLDVHGLTIRDADGQLLLTDINFNVDPGQITGIVGASGAGKSLLLKAISDPFSLSHTEVTGSVHMGHRDLWNRRSTDQRIPFVMLPSEPVILPATGADNLSCFHGGEMLSRGKWFLERLVFAVDMVEAICKAPDAQTLPSMQKKALALARAFLLAPPLYLMDRPEDGLPDKQIFALVNRLSREARLGRSVLLITNNRALLESCDRLVVMQQGRIVDYGPADEVSSRMGNGWSRLLGSRTPDTEEVLVNWIRSHFHRDGDEANRRKVSEMASDLLTLSYQHADAQSDGDVQFLFKHFEGHCLLRMSDDDPPLAASVLRKASEEAKSKADDHKLSPLGSILRNAQKVECDTKQDTRRITVQIETYDPRKMSGAGNAG